jgi:hypothetical protein
MQTANSFISRQMHGRRNHIHYLLHEGTPKFTHEAKAQAPEDFFSKHLGFTDPRQHTINWDTICPDKHDLSDLDRDITEEEIHAAVMQIPSKKVPGPDGYIGGFFKMHWNIIRLDLIAALREIFKLRAGCWQLLNSANMILIPKKDGSQNISDFRLINIMHIIAKILAKVISNRLAPKLDQLVSNCQSAFIKGMSIHDNFQYVRGGVKHFHEAKTRMLLIKLDIAKAFNSVRWEYLLEVMTQLGFGQRWRDIISLLWGTKTSRIMLSGQLGKPIKHARGLR